MGLIAIRTFKPLLIKTFFKELATTNRWTTNLFATDVYRLNANLMSLCAAHGIKNEVLIVINPFNNLLLLTQELSKNKVIFDFAKL